MTSCRLCRSEGAISGQQAIGTVVALLGQNVNRYDKPITTEYAGLGGRGDPLPTVEKTRSSDELSQSSKPFLKEPIMKTVKSTVYVSDDKLTTKDKDGNEKVIYVFPDPLPAGVVHKDGKYVIDVTYIDPEVGDITFDEDYASSLPSDLTAEDLTKACKAGIRLALGDLAKDAFKAEPTGGLLKVKEAAMSWAAQPEQASVFAKWVKLVQAGNKDQADKDLIEAYQASKK